MGTLHSLQGYRFNGTPSGNNRNLGGYGGPYEEYAELFIHLILKTYYLLLARAT